MRSRSIAFLLASSSILGSLAGIACSRDGDSTESGSADLSTADAASPPALLAKKLGGAWLAPANGPGSTAALVITPSSANDGSIAVLTDRIHTPTSALDKQETDRNFADATVVLVSGATSGELETHQFAFVPPDQNLDQITRFGFSIQTIGAASTLTLTALSVKTVGANSGPDGGPGEIDAGAVALPPPATFSLAPSWCADSTSLPGHGVDCEVQMHAGTFIPPNLPAKCEQNPNACLKCENHACKVQDVSSCEIANDLCLDSIEHCEFDPGGKPAGEAASVDSQGVPIDCKGSPTGKAICCLDLTGALHGGGNGPIADPIFLPPPPPPPPP